MPTLQQSHSDAAHQITEYISSMPEWSRAICNHLRNIIHKADPQMVEDWKWGPNFNHNGMVCGFAAFKKHVVMAFFQGTQLKDPKKILTLGENNLHTKRVNFKDIAEIKEKILIDLIRDAVQINVTGKAMGLSKASIVEIETPADLQKLLEVNKLTEFFDMMPYTHRKEYIMAIFEAKKEETRKRRLDKTIEMLLAKVK